MRKMTLVAAVAAAVSLATCDLAAAARPQAGRTYGGGTIGSSNTTGTTDVNFVDMAVTSSRKSALIRAQLNHNCSSSLPPNTNVFFTLKAKLRHDGSFTASGPVSAPGPGGTEDGSAKAKGRFTSAGRAVGTISADTAVKLNSGAQGTCSTGTLHFQVDLPGARGQSGKAKAKAAYFGVASIGGPIGIAPVLVRVGSSARKLDRFAIPFLAKCSSGRTLQQSEIAPPAAISKTGKFTDSDKFSAPMGDVTADIDAETTGRFTRTRVSGTFRLVANIKDSTGKQVDTCDTGVVKWKASR